VRSILAASLFLFGLFVWLYFRRFEGDLVALIIGAWTVVALARLHVVDTVLADIPFCAALWLVFRIADSPDATPGARHYIALALAGALAFAFRMAALPLIPAIACFALLRPAAERRALISVGAVWLLSAIAVLFLLPGADALGSEVARSPADVAYDVWMNMRESLDGARDWVALRLPFWTANIVLHGSALLVASWGAILALREHPRRFAYLTSAWYLLMLVVIPTGSGRYVWPLYPLIAFAFIRGLRWIVAPLALGARAKALGLSAAVTLLALSLLQDVVAPPPRSIAGDVETQEVVAALRREALARPVRAAFFSPRVLTWETGITTTGFSSGSPDAIYEQVRRLGLTHVVVGNAGTYALGRAATASMVAQHHNSFVPLLANKSFVVYAVRDSADFGR
jgi:hypothetical protein